MISPPLDRHSLTTAVGVENIAPNRFTLRVKGIQSPKLSAIMRLSPRALFTATTAFCALFLVHQKSSIAVGSVRLVHTAPVSVVVADFGCDYY
jgi:hypothetical protein